MQRKESIFNLSCSGGAESYVSMWYCRKQACLYLSILIQHLRKIFRTYRTSLYLRTFFYSPCVPSHTRRVARIAKRMDSSYVQFWPILCQAIIFYGTRVHFHCQRLCVAFTCWCSPEWALWAVSAGYSPGMVVYNATILGICIYICKILL